MFSRNSSLKKFISIKFILCLNLLFFDSFLSNYIVAENLNNKPTAEYLRRKTNDSFYIIGAGDVLYISINDYTKELNDIFTVDGEGFLKLKNLNKVYVKGLTIDELSDILNQEYSGIVKEPAVNINTIKYRPVRIVIEGEVENTGIHILPGTYNLNVNTEPDTKISLSNQTKKSIFGVNNTTSNNIIEGEARTESVFFPTVFEAIRKSGGITLNADLNKFAVTFAVPKPPQTNLCL